MGAIDDGKTYDDLIGKTVQLSLGDDRTIDVLDLRTLIEVKRRAGRPKDLAAIPVLEATLDERERRGYGVVGGTLRAAEFLANCPNHASGVP